MTKWCCNIFLIILLGLTVHSCSNKPADVVGKKAMIAFYSDYFSQLGAAIAQDTKYGETNYKKQVLIYCLKKHNISEIEFESTVKYYSKKPEQYIEILEKSKKQIEKNLPLPKEQKEQEQDKKEN